MYYIAWFQKIKTQAYSGPYSHKRDQNSENFLIFVKIEIFKVSNIEHNIFYKIKKRNLILPTEN